MTTFFINELLTNNLLVAATSNVTKHKNLFIFNIFYYQTIKCLSSFLVLNLKCTTAFCQKMSNHCERISSTAGFFDSTLTFDFRAGSLPLKQDRFKAAEFTTTKWFFIINTIVLMLENENF